MKLKHEAFFEKLSEKLHSDVGVQRAYGEPIEFEGRKIIPVANISYHYGFGEGGGGEDQPAQGENPDENGMASGGYGYGGGSKAEPVGVIEITPDGTAFLPVNPRRELAKGIALGVVIGLVLARLLRR